MVSERLVAARSILISLWKRCRGSIVTAPWRKPRGKVETLQKNFQLSYNIWFWKFFVICLQDFLNCFFLGGLWPSPAPSLTYLLTLFLLFYPQMCMCMKQMQRNYHCIRFQHVLITMLRVWTSLTALNLQNVQFGAAVRRARLRQRVSLLLQ